MTSKNCLCEQCSDALGSKHHICDSLFIKEKDIGGLFKPSKSVIKIYEETETKIQGMLHTTGGKLPQGTGITEAIATAVLGDLPLSDIFPELNEHMLETSVTDNHVFQLIKSVT